MGVQFRMCTVRTVILGWLAAGMVACQAAGQVAPLAGSNSPKPPPIVLKKKDAGRFVYLEHQGPYWNAGPLVTSVRDLMAAKKESGPLQIRLAGDPTTTPENALRSKIGFLATGDWVPDAPFKEEKLGPEEVASTTVEGPHGTTTQYYPTLRTWIHDQGLEPSGPVVEIVPTQDTKGNELRTEIQIPVRRPKAAIKKELEEGGSKANEPTLVSGRTEVKDGPARKGPDAEIQQQAGNRRPIRELLDQKEYLGIAEQLISNEPAQPREVQIWLGQIVFRVGAVAKGLLLHYPDQAGDLAVFSDILFVRLEKLLPGVVEESLKKAVVRVNPQDSSAEARRNTMVQELDKLLARVSSKAMDPKATALELARILQKVQDSMVAETR